MTLLSNFEVRELREEGSAVAVTGVTTGGFARTFHAPVAVMASGAIGNVAMLLRSGFGDRLSAVGRGFYTHPQYMVLARYAEVINAHKGPFQAFKSSDPGFRAAGFKLENVFAPPASLATLLPGIGVEHMARMEQLTSTACIEVAVRDTGAGRVRLGSGGRTVVEKVLNAEDRRRRDAGLKAVENIFRSTGARDWHVGRFAIGLHLMGGCAMGVDPARSVVGPDFRVHGTRRLFAADSSLFPDAPGINPSLTVMALAQRAAQEVVGAC
jgi:choline dehydrogenase-like flavoprotein